MKELIGFNNFPNDFTNFSLRAKLYKKFGMFGKIPMWGGIRLHQFYPPLTSLIVGLFGVTATVILYFIFTFGVWAYYQGPLAGLLFLISFYHFTAMFYLGRLSEFLGYSFIALAFFNNNPVISGVFLGCAGLSYPVPFLVGIFILLFKFNPITFLVAFLICGWWYIPFVLRRKSLSFLKEERPDKHFGLYLVQWASVLNFILFLSGPLWLRISLGVGVWFSPIIYIYIALPYEFAIRNYFSVIKTRLKNYFCLKPFFNSDLPKIMPGLDTISEKMIVIEQSFLEAGFAKDEKRFSGSFKLWVWACANYLIDKDIIVYNGLPSTEVSSAQINIPDDIKIYSVWQLGLKITK